MSLGIVHFSDIHFDNKKENTLLEKQEKIISGLQNKLLEFSHVIIAITGDIAQKGIEEEYKMAFNFFDNIRKGLFEYTSIPIDFIITPGNHDNNYGDYNETEFRNKVLINNARDSKELNPILIEQILKPQKEYNEFYEKLMANSNLTKILSDKLNNTYLLELRDKKILINTYNTAWVSIKNEEPGKMFFPIEKKDEGDIETDISISMMHHNFNWLEPNNSREFKELIEENSDLILTGHEHTLTIEKRTRLTNISKFEVEHFEGSVLQDRIKKENSSFSLIGINFNEKSKKIQNFKWSENEKIYLPDSKIILGIVKKCNNQKCEISKEFMEYLNDPGLNLEHPRKEKVTLQDFYIDHNLTLLDLTKEEIEKETILASTIMGLPKDKINFVLGDEKNGKTSLLKHIFLKLNFENKTPLLLDGNNIKNKDLHKLLKEEYLKQYNSNKSYDFYEQLDKSKKILLIDDFHKILPKQKEKILQALPKYFDLCLFTIDNLFEFDLIKSKTKYNRIQIEDFNESQRYLLVDKWIKLKNEDDERNIMQKIHETKRTLDISIANNITPSRPLFLLVSLQTFETRNSFKLEESSRGYYYEFLLIQSVSQITQDDGDIRGLFAFLSELAYFYYRQKNITKSELLEFHKEYIERKDIDSSFKELYDFNRLIDSLVNVNLLSMKQEEYKFKYNFIYYYFISKYIADKITKDSIKDVFKDLTTKMHLEESANIILFLTHHSKDPFIIEEIIKKAETLFENVEPIEFEADIKNINDLVSTLPKFKINENNNYQQNRLENYAEIDELEKTVPKNKEVQEENDTGNEINLAFKTIEILGNILKNYHSTMDGKNKKELLEVACKLGFRANGFFFNLIKEDLEIFLDKLSSDGPVKISRVKEFQRIQKSLFHFMNIISLFFLIKMGDSLSYKKLNRTYERLEKDLSNNAVKILNLIMKMEYSDNFPVVDIKRLANEIKDNNFSKMLVTYAILRYIRLFPVSLTEKQTVCSLFNIDIKKENIGELKSIALRDEKILTSTSGEDIV